MLMSFRIISKTAIVIASVVLSTGAALAQSTVCAELSADLASLNRRAPAYDPYGDAITKQKAAIDRAQADYQRQCSTGLFSRPSPNCPAITERLQAMQANLQKLQRVAPPAAARTDDPGRQKLLSLMRQNRCGEPGNGIVTTLNAPQPGSLFASSNPPGTQTSFGRTFTLPGPNGPMIYREEPGGRIVALGPASTLVQPQQPQRRSAILSTDPRDETDPDTPAADDTRDPDASGTYRTLCVRTCDGYYFPISYAATRGQFSNDAEVCHARCPAADTQLYAVKTPGEDGEQSFATDTGEPYTKLPNALRYRREVVNACTCGRPDPALMPAASLSQDDFNQNGTKKIGDIRPGLPQPDPRPLLGEDPETLADIDADFTPRPIEPPAAAVAVGPEPLRGPMTPRTVRIVGPKFYADR